MEGPKLTYSQKKTLEYIDCDFAIQGEGEETIVELVNALKSKKPLKNIKGLIFRKGGQIIVNPPRPLIKNLDDIPFPAWHLLPINKYKSLFSRTKKFATMVTSRGCPFNCIFCSDKSRLGRMFRYRSPDNIIKEIKFLINNHGIKEILFYDDTFTVNRNRIIELCKKILAENIKVSWECRTRVDLVDKELIELMKKSGCYRIRYGIEAGNQRILNVLKKGITLEQAEKAIRITKEAGIETVTYFMMGSPCETIETINNSINFSIKLNPDYSVFAITSPSDPNSELFNWALKNNYINENYWDDFMKGLPVSSIPMLVNSELKESTLKKLRRQAYMKFYLRTSKLKLLFKNITLSKIRAYFSVLISVLSGKF